MFTSVQILYDHLSSLSSFVDLTHNLAMTSCGLIDFEIARPSRAK